MTIEVAALAASMIGAAREAMGDRWPSAQALAEVELRRLAQCVSDIAALLSDGAIDRSEAQHLLRIQQLTTRSVLQTVRGLGLLTAERAITAAAGTIGSSVNAVVGFKLL